MVEHSAHHVDCYRVSEESQYSYELFFMYQNDTGRMNDVVKQVDYVSLRDRHTYSKYKANLHTLLVFIEKCKRLICALCREALY